MDGLGVGVAREGDDGDRPCLRILFEPSRGGQPVDDGERKVHRDDVRAVRARLRDRTTKSKALFERAVKHLPLGVGSSFQAGDPYPVYLERGEGPRVWDVDGNEYLDFHGGFGVNVVGHGHPKIVEAVEKAVRSGTHFAVTTEKTVALAEELCRRFRLDKVRFCNSGTEATMDAVRIARAATGRDVVAKIEGSYHGHHDTVTGREPSSASSGFPRGTTLSDTRASWRSQLRAARVMPAASALR